jgi:hypothetical protein
LTLLVQRGPFDGTFNFNGNYLDANTFTRLFYGRDVTFSKADLQLFKTIMDHKSYRSRVGSKLSLLSVIAQVQLPPSNRSSVKVEIGNEQRRLPLWTYLNDNCLDSLRRTLFRRLLGLGDESARSLNPLEFEVCLGIWFRFPYLPLAAWLDDCRELRSFKGGDYVGRWWDRDDGRPVSYARQLLVHISDPKFNLSYWASKDGRTETLYDFADIWFLEALSDLINLLHWTQADITLPSKFLEEMLRLKRSPTAVVPQCSDLEVGRLNLSDFDAAFICSGPFKFVRTLEFDKHLYLDEKGQIHVYWGSDRIPGNLQLYREHPVWNYQGHNSA